MQATRMVRRFMAQAVKAGAAPTEAAGAANDKAIKRTANRDGTEQECHTKRVPGATEVVAPGTPG